MNRFLKKIAHQYYEIPARVKFHLASGMLFIMVLLGCIYFINLIGSNSLQNQYLASSKNLLQNIVQLINADSSSKSLQKIANLNYIEKVIIKAADSTILYESTNIIKNWQGIDFFRFEINYDDQLADLWIGINKNKQIDVISTEFNRYKNFTIYIVTLLAFLIVIIVNLVLIRPIDQIFLNLKNINEDHPDDTGNSQLYELNETIAFLKNNIKKLKDKEDELLQSRERLSAVLNTVGDAILTIDKEGKIVMVNDAFQRIWGYQKQEILGQTLEPLMPERHRRPHKEGMDRYMTTGIERVLNRDLILDAVHKDGHSFPIELHIAETRLNNELFFTAAVRDITERQRIQSELFEAKRNIEDKLSEKTADLVSKISELNCLYGFSRLIEHEHEDISFILKETLLLIKAAFKYPDNASCMIFFDGHEYKTPGFKISSVKLEKDISIKQKKAGYISVCYQNEELEFLPYEQELIEIITLRLSRYMEHRLATEELASANQTIRETQMQLIQAEKLDTIGTLSAGIAHEVKNPLAIIQLGIDYLNRKSFDNENIRQVIEEMDDAIRRADTVIKQLVNFSASNDLTMEKEDINASIDRGLSLVKHEIQKNNITLNKNYYQTLPLISIDRQKFEQVIINLTINAIHAMAQSAEKVLTISTTVSKPDDIIDLDETGSFNVSDTVVVISIQDSGSGIDEDTLNNMFEPFYTTKPAGKGTGLGLTVCQNIIRLHGGHLFFENSDQGAVAKIVLRG